MDRVELTIADVERLLKWRDEHRDEVRSFPAPLRAVEFRVKENGWQVKAVRDGGTIRFNLCQNGKRFGNCTFLHRSDGMCALAKNKTGLSGENLRGVLTVYCSLMALMTYGKLEQSEEPREVRETKPHKPSQGRHKPRSGPRVSYILREVNGELTAASRGSHASPRGEFTVRGHYRHYKSGKTVWIAEYRKGSGKKKSKTYKMGGKQDGVQEKDP